MFEPLNNREIASGIWLGLFFGLSLTMPSVRGAYRGVIASFAAPQVSVVFGLAIVYILAAIIVLWAIGVWDSSSAKDSIIWFVAGASVSIFGAATTQDFYNSMKARLIALAKLTFWIEFIVAAYTFPLAVELVLVLFLSLLVLTRAVAYTDPKYSTVTVVLEKIQIVVGVGMLVGVAAGITENWREISATDTVKAIALVPTLSVLLVPYLYGVALYSGYDQVIRRMSMFADERQVGRWFLFRRVAVHANLRLGSISHLASEHSSDLMRIRDRGDVDELINQSPCH